MRMKEQHKQFAVKCYAKFMKTSDVVDAFVLEFENDLPKPKPLPNLEQITTDEQYENEKQQYVEKKLQILRNQYIEKHGKQAEEKFLQEIPAFEQLLRDEYDQSFKQDYINKKMNDILNRYNDSVEEHFMKLTAELSNQLCRLNIRHSRFPHKYRSLFIQTRKEFIKSHRNDNLQQNQEIRNELETIYGYVKELMFKEELPRNSVKHADMALKILKAIAACNKEDTTSTDNS